MKPVNSIDWWTNKWLTKNDHKSVPSEHIVRFAKTKFSDLSGLSVLDIGFSTSGAELLFFLSCGCHCYGLEVSEDICRMFISKYQLQNEPLLRVGTAESFQFPESESLDLVYSIETLHYLESKQKVREWIELSHSLLRRGGWMLVSLIRPDHFFCSVSHRFDAEGRIFNNGYPSRKGLRFLVFETEKELRTTFDLFSHVEIGYYKYGFNYNELRSFWLVTCCKE